MIIKPPKDKAKELVEKFLKEVDTIDNYWDSDEQSRQCALICVDEIIKSLRKTLPEVGLGKGYWYSVRKEIEILKNE